MVIEYKLFDFYKLKSDYIHNKCNGDMYIQLIIGDCCIEVCAERDLIWTNVYTPTPSDYGQTADGRPYSMIDGFGIDKMLLRRKDATFRTWLKLKSIEYLIDNLSKEELSFLQSGGFWN